MPITTLLITACCIVLFIITGGLALTRPKKEAKPKAILIVDDAPVVQIMMGKLLKDLGCHYESAMNGREALRMIDTNSYDLIFMDCQMPVLDGFTATQAIRELPGSTDKKPVIVAITADNEDADKKRCLDAGMNDFVPKPFRTEHIDHVLKKWLT